MRAGVICYLLLVTRGAASSGVGRSRCANYRHMTRRELAYLKLSMFADRPSRNLFLPILSPLPRLPFVDEYYALNIEHSYSNIDVCNVLRGVLADVAALTAVTSLTAQTGRFNSTH